jgi:hypothetical protein
LSKGVSRVLDCAVEEYSVRDVPEVVDYTISLINRVMGKNTSLLFDSSECIGTTHTLYRFRIVFEKGKYIGVRVVVRGRKIVRVLLTIPMGLDIGLHYQGSIYNPTRELAWKQSITQTDPPRGQVYVDLPVVYAILGIPEVDLRSWRLSIDGLVENTAVYTLPELYDLGVETVKTSFHCVTGWSVRELEFTGVPAERIIEVVKPLKSVEWVYVESLDGYTTILPFTEFNNPKTLIAIEMNGKPLDILHGYPARLVIPQLYGWKSAKWVSRISFMDKYIDGYWESLGYHPRGRVDLEERFKST